MKMRIENQEQFSHFVNIKIDNAFRVYKKNFDKKRDGDLYQTIALNKLRAAQTKLLNNPKFIDFFREVFNLYRYGNIDQSYFNAITTFCKDNCKEIDEVAPYIANVKFTLEAFDKVRGYHKDHVTNKIDAETLEVFLKSIEVRQNEFVKQMPIKDAFEHFRVFIANNSKNGQPFLTETQFISFIKRAFLNSKEEPKITLNVGNREKSLIVGRFYKFYRMGSDYEKTTQCKPKYIKLLSDNFNNWEYHHLVHNFKDHNKNNW